MRFLRRVRVPVAVGAFTLSRLHRVFDSDPYVPSSINVDAIVQFNSGRVLHEVFAPAGTVAHINYLDADAHPEHANAVRLPWSLKLVTTLTAVAANVLAHLQELEAILGASLYERGPRGVTPTAIGTPSPDMCELSL